MKRNKSRSSQMRAIGTLFGALAIATVSGFFGPNLMAQAQVQGQAQAQEPPPVSPINYYGANPSVMSLVQSANQLLGQCYHGTAISNQQVQSFMQSAEMMARQTKIDTEEASAARLIWRNMWIASKFCGR